jgi:hypothetical protein
MSGYSLPAVLQTFHSLRGTGLHGTALHRILRSVNVFGTDWLNPPVCTGSRRVARPIRLAGSADMPLLQEDRVLSLRALRSVSPWLTRTPLLY